MILKKEYIEFLICQKSRTTLTRVQSQCKHKEQHERNTKRGRNSGNP